MPRETPAPAEISLRTLSDAELLRRLVALLGQSRRVEADLIAHIGEVDVRRLYAREAFPSMFAYATGALHLSEGEAYARIAVARAARQHPVLLAKLRDGRLHLTGIAKLLPHLTNANRASLLARAEHKTKRQIEELIAELAPRPDVPATMRKLPQPRGGVAQPVSPSAAIVEPKAAPREPAGPGRGDEGLPVSELPSGTEPSKPVTAPWVRRTSLPAATPPRLATVQPLAPTRYRIQFTASAGLHAKLERLQALTRSSVPDGDLATLIEQAVTERLERLEARRFAKARSPRKGLEEADTSAQTRYIPAPIRRVVYERDGGRCATSTRAAGAVRNGTTWSSTTTRRRSDEVATTNPEVYG
jgi:hypothetical protein